MVRATFRTLSRDRPVSRPLSMLSPSSFLLSLSRLQWRSNSWGFMSPLHFDVWNRLACWVRVSETLFFIFSVVNGFFSEDISV